jgi:hypothetical protein
MRSAKLLAASLGAAVMLTLVLATTAVALPQFLPIASPNNTFSLSTGLSARENTAGTIIECLTGTGTGGFETDTLGTFHIKFEKCKANGFQCESEGDTNEIILSEGSFHFVYDTLGTGETLGVAILLLTKEASIACAAVIVTDKITGSVMCLIVVPLTSTVTHEFDCFAGKRKGEQLTKEYWNDGGTQVFALLLSNVNKAGPTETNLQLTSKMTTTELGAWMNE